MARLVCTWIYRFVQCLLLHHTILPSILLKSPLRKQNLCLQLMDLANLVASINFLVLLNIVLSEAGYQNFQVVIVNASMVLQKHAIERVAECVVVT